MNSRGSRSRPTPAAFDVRPLYRPLLERLARSIFEFRNIRAERIEISVVIARTRRRAGLLARIAPLRFPGGESLKIVRSTVGGRARLSLVSLPDQAAEPRAAGAAPVSILYNLGLVFPRFFDLGAREKLETLVHELFHVDPAFDGSIRAFLGRGCHGGSGRFESEIARLTDEYLKRDAEGAPPIPEHLHLDARAFVSRFGRPYGGTTRRPRARTVSIGLEAFPGTLEDDPE